MWQVVQRGDVQDYGMLEEFVTMVTEIVPELLSCSQRAQLILGLRARLVLELCRTEQTLDLTNIQKHLDRIRSLTSTEEAEDVFPVEFGPKYDTAIQMLMLEFLSRLEKLLPIPDLEQVIRMNNTFIYLAWGNRSKEYQVIINHIFMFNKLCVGHEYVVVNAFKPCSSLSRLPPYVDSDTQSEGMNLEGMEARELLENRTKEIDVLVAADEVRRYIITEPDYGMDMESAVGENDNQAVTDQHQEEESSELVAVNADTPETSTSRLQLVHWCKKCGKCFDDICNLKQHQESSCKEGKIKVVFQCEKRKDFKGSSSLRTHKRIHNPFYCSDCGRVLPNSIAFDRHKLMQHKEIQCTMCEKTFTLLGRLRDHYLHQHKFTGPYPCSQCEKTFTQLRYLVEHERVHSGEYPYQCSVCQAKFNKANSLTIHSRKHTGEKPFLCWQCGKSYKDRGNLSMHMGTHSEERPFSCSQCDMTYRTKIQLNTHIEQVHEGVRYTCAVCGKQFLKAVSLIRHELTHTGERPWPCSYCTKTFITANERRLHERYHTGERPYKCQDCGKSFVQLCFLKAHQRLHTGEKPFACSVCDKRFRLNYHRQRHEQTHTGKQKPHVCAECGLAFAQRKRLTEHQCTHSLN
uniref:C2H2-type domain-containing protein n=1 Tax=Oncorhynchus kisutch TaxID=8019 RepID=A0A8C7H6V9_ONCKI